MAFVTKMLRIYYLFVMTYHSLLRYCLGGKEARPYKQAAYITPGDEQ